jgi:hypothetical protein
VGACHRLGRPPQRLEARLRPKNGTIVVLALAFVGGACGTHPAGQFVAPASDAAASAFGSDSGDSDPCLEASQAHSSVGCEYYAIHMDGAFDADNGCFVAFLANTSAAAAHLDVSFAGAPIDLGSFARLPHGAGLSLKYDPFDPGAGLAPGEVAILFLAGPPTTKPLPVGDQHDPVPCPVLPSRSTLSQVHGTGMGGAFRIRTDQPIVAYQMLPYGGGTAAVTGATLLLPTSAYGTNYVAVNAGGGPVLDGPNLGTSLDVVATADDTTVTILPRVDIVAGGGVAGSPAGAPATFMLDQGQVLQLTQPTELTGSPISSDRPIGLFGGHPCADIPSSLGYCDHAEQQFPPIASVGNGYAAVTYRQRTATPESPPWRIVGLVDGTQLTYDPPVGGPSSIDLTNFADFNTATPFTVRSQDAAHPFLLIGHMTGATTVTGNGYGDPDFVRTIPSAQYLSTYVFFTDPTYPETNLVFVRQKSPTGYADVTLDCKGTLDGWTAIDGADTYEYTRVDLVRHNFQPQGACNNGRHEATSTVPFGLTVWGWGTPETNPSTGYVSYAYPAGENLAPLNTVVIPTQ